jgi:hypothetical protein
LSESKNFKLFFLKESKLKLEDYSDVFYASYSDIRKSYSRNAFRLKNVIIIWKSQKQKCVMKFIIETEYVTLSLVSSQMIWLKRALKKLRYDVSCVLFTDITKVKDIVENLKINKRTKHIDVIYHYMREKLLEEEFVLFYISST